MFDVNEKIKCVLDDQLISQGMPLLLRIDSTGGGWFQVFRYKSGTKKSRILCDMSNESYYLSPSIDAY